MASSSLEQCRALMREHGVDYYFVPHADAHQSEYVPEHLKRRDFISGFTGSAGDVLVGLDAAYLWTDGRYFLQAEKELNLDEFTLMKSTQGMAPPIHEWLATDAKGKKVGVDPTVLTAGQADRFAGALTEGGELVFIDENLIDQVREVPAANSAPVFLADESVAGQTASDKIKQMQTALAEHKVNAMAVNALDSIAWLFNIRGGDTPFNPLVISYAVVDQNGAHWFVDAHKLDDAISEYCHQHGIEVHPYEDFFAALSVYDSVWIDPGFASAKMHQAINGTALLKQLPIDLAKACKTDAEIKSTIQAHREDAVSLINFIHWAENNWQGQNEFTAAQKLHEFRSQNSDFKGASFETISGYGPNGAVIHYRVEDDSALPLADDNLYLVDSGAQYQKGTTDVTRVMHFGEPTAEHKRHYTLVLKGHLALARATFAHGASGFQLDTFARQFLWEDGLDYMHGTGHGVGVFLCVHEGPQRISPGPIRQELLPNMIVSNEPGVYLPGKHGIRIENLSYIAEVKGKDQFNIGVGPFYQLQDLTLVPYNAKLIEMSLLTEQEVDQINAYHERIASEVLPQLSGDVASWCQKAIAKL